MKSKAEKRINGGLAIYYGIGGLVTGAGILIYFFTWLYEVFFGDREFSLGACLGLLIVSMIFLAIGYSILRVGYEELEEPH